MTVGAGGELKHAAECPLLIVMNSLVALLFLFSYVYPYMLVSSSWFSLMVYVPQSWIKLAGYILESL